MTTQTPLPKGIRLTKVGSYELTLNSTLLPKGRVFRSFNSIEDAVAYQARMLEILLSGNIPPELLRRGAGTVRKTRASSFDPAPRAKVQVGNNSPLLGALLKEYLADASIAFSSREYAVIVSREVTGQLDGVTTTWIDSWVKYLKQERRNKPSTIKKKVEVLARAIDWWNRKHYTNGQQPVNVLRLLPKGYATYREGDVDEGEEMPKDVERNRRLLPGEYEKFVAALTNGEKFGKERPFLDKDDPEAAAWLMLIQLLVATGLRLREAMRLRLKYINFELATIHVDKSKTGPTREVPLTLALEDLLKDYITKHKVTDILFPWWNGVESEEKWRVCSGSISRRFKTLAVHCGCEDLLVHDLRHEAVCRWMLMRDRDNRWMFRGEEVMRITGHKSTQMFQRYFSLQGSSLASRLRE